MKSAQERHKEFRQRTKKIGLYVTPEYYEDLSRYSKEHQIPIRQMILQSLDQYIKAHPVKSES